MDKNVEEQLVSGISKICTTKNQDCNTCPFYIGECPFGQTMPSSWTNTTVPDKIKINLPQKTPMIETAGREYAEELLGEKLPDLEPIEKINTPEVNNEPEPEPEIIKQENIGTWEIRTTMSKGLLSKYVFICSKCGYQKESYFSSPMGTCPNCDKNNFNDIITKIE